MVYVLAAGVVAACVFLFCFFLNVCLLAGYHKGSPSGFSIEAVGCFSCGFYYSSWLSGFVLIIIVFSDNFFLSLSRFPFFFFALPLSLFPCKVLY